ncbi:MAG: SoxR reducing system RseC family protein [Firmicutes bacterium]|nr:SoxR reducing system RseC family protein [Bacillota bacterium]
MRQIGVVVKDCGEKVKVKIARSSACEQCGQCSNAERRVQSLLAPRQEIEVEAVNKARAAVGETVELSVPGSSVLKAAVWVYLLPWAAVIGGAIAGHRLGPSLGLGQEGGSIILAALCLAGGYGLLRWQNRRLEQDHSYVSTVERILP